MTQVTHPQVHEIKRCPEWPFYAVLAILTVALVVTYSLKFAGNPQWIAASYVLCVPVVGLFLVVGHRFYYEHYVYPVELDKFERSLRRKHAQELGLADPYPPATDVDLNYAQCRSLDRFH